MEWLALVGPLERLGHGAVEVGDEGQHLVRRSSMERKLPRRRSLRTRMLSQISTWFSQDACLGV